MATRLCAQGAGRTVPALLAILLPLAGQCQSQTDPGPATGGVDHFYDDGYVRVDATGNAGGQTWFWGYEHASQIQGDTIVFHSVSEGLTGTTTIIDAYDLGSTVPPAAPYQGTFHGPGPTISDMPSRMVWFSPKVPVFAAESDQFTHPYLLWDVGTRLDYVGYGDVAGIRLSTEVVAREQVDGVNCLRVVTKKSTEADRLKWLAQDTDGNVWQIRSLDTLTDDGCDDRVLYLPADPVLDREYSLWDCAFGAEYIVTSLNAPVSTPFWDFARCLVLRREGFGEIEEYAFAPGWGMVKLDIEGSENGGWHLSAALGVTSSDPLDAWHWRNPLPGGGHLMGIASSGTQIVAVGEAGRILTSSDGINWTTRASGTAEWLFDVVWADTQFVAVGGAILTSPDGIVWTVRDSDSWLQGIAWNGSLLVAVSRFGPPIITSPDGVSWTAQSAANLASLEAVTWGNGLFVAVGMWGSIFTSSDGTEWTARDSGTASLWDVTWGGGQFVAVGDGGTVLTSADGVSWVRRESGADHLLRGVGSSGGEFVAVGRTYPRRSTILRSADGINWTRHDSGTAAWLESVAWTGNQLVAVGEGGAILTSADGTAWTGIWSRTFTELYGVGWNGSQFTAVGLHGTILTSPDGIEWTPRDSGTIEHLGAVTGNSDRWVVVGWDWDPDTETSTGVILTSDDGVAWTRFVPSVDQLLKAVTWNGSQFVTVGGGGTILSSPDGTSWVRRESGTDAFLAGVAWNGIRFVAVGDGGTVLTSPDGIAWTRRESGTSNQLRGIAWNGSQLVAVGGDGTILSSRDGVDWTQRDAGTLELLEGVAWGGGQFVVAGFGTILTSADGNDWQPRYSGTARWLRSAAWGTDSFVAVGESGTILQSGTITSDPPPAELRIELFDGMAVIRWPVSMESYVLEYIETVGDGSVWMPVEVEPELIETEFVLIVPLAGEGRFYRLRLP
jgi:hypothetical protein